LSGRADAAADVRQRQFADGGADLTVEVLVLGLDPRIRGWGGLFEEDDAVIATVNPDTAHRTVRSSGQARG
ncbi:MAG: hypothetical protein U1E18_32130, partial [Brevundimonas sp.]|uniref:hypothetical protein n=1 Tax=Brevundimonas sp. TaxID=1871086 RepID=UPI002AB8B5A1